MAAETEMDGNELGEGLGGGPQKSMCVPRISMRETLSGTASKATCKISVAATSERGGEAGEAGSAERGGPVGLSRGLVPWACPVALESARPGAQWGRLTALGGGELCRRSEPRHTTPLR